MRRALALFLALYGLSATDPYAQTVPTRPVTDDSNSAASTAFVKNVLGALSGDCTINPATLVVACTGGGGGSLVVGTTPITGGVNGDCLYDNGPGTLGEKACGGTAVGYVQDFIEGTDFTTGVTTQLTLTHPPATAANIQIFFDGVNQSANTWSFNPSTGVVTFDQAITASFVVEARSVVATGAGTGNVSTGGTLTNNDIVVGAGGTSVQDSGTTVAAINASIASSAAAVAATIPNDLIDLYENPQFQILSVISGGYISQVGPQSLSTLPSFTVTGSNTGAGYICFNVSGSPRIQYGDLVGLTGAGINAAINASNGKFLRVNGVVGSPVTQFCAYSEFATFVPGASQSGTGQIYNLGDLTGTAAEAAMAWSKTSGLQEWPSRYAADKDPSAIRALGLYMGGNAAPLYLGQNLSVNLYTALQGHVITNRWRVQQRVKGGSGTSEAYCIANGSTEVDGPAAVGGGSYEDVTLQYTVPTNLTSLQCGIKFLGATTDAYYVDNPMLADSPTIPANYFRERPHDFFFLRQDLATFDGESFQFPASADPTGVYYSLYADVYVNHFPGYIDWTVTGIQGALEGNCTNAAQAMDIRDVLGNTSGLSIVYGTAVYTQIANAMNAGSETIPLDTGLKTNSLGPGFFIVYSASSGALCHDVSMDVQGYYLN